MRKALAAVIFLAATAMFAQPACDVTLWHHVYHHSRLTVIKNCTTVTGTVRLIKPERDGDLHVRLELDPEFASMLNAVNWSKQDGTLVIEPMCTHRVTQADAEASCVGFHQNFPELIEGAHVRVTGSYVVDHDRGHGWREIHPITAVEVVQ